MIKNFIMMLFMMLTVSTAAMANEVNVDKRVDEAKKYLTLEIAKKKNYDFHSVDLDKANKYLQLNKQDLELIKQFHQVFAEQMDLASKTDNVIKRDSIVKGAIKYMENGAVMTIEKKDEYSRFFRLFNVTLNNRGFGDDIAKLNN